MCMFAFTQTLNINHKWPEWIVDDIRGDTVQCCEQMYAPVQVDTNTYIDKHSRRGWLSQYRNCVFGVHTHRKRMIPVLDIAKANPRIPLPIMALLSWVFTNNAVTWLVTSARCHMCCHVVLHTRSSYMPGLTYFDKVQLPDGDWGVTFPEINRRTKTSTKTLLINSCLVLGSSPKLNHPIICNEEKPCWRFCSSRLNYVIQLLSTSFF